MQTGRVATGQFTAWAARHPLLATALLVMASLGLVELGLHALLGNYAITDLYEYHPADGRCVGLRPGAAVDYTGWLFRVSPIHLAVNRAGYRGTVRPKAKTADRYRVLVLGDSYVFGQGVGPGGALPVQLEQVLGECRGRRVEVLNFGVPGLNVEEIVDHYRRFASRWAHDLVLYVAFENDLDGPLCRKGRRYAILDSAAFHALNRHVRASRLLYISFLMAATEDDPRDARPAQRLRAAEAALVEHARASGAQVGVVLLGDPLRKRVPEGPGWAPAVPMLDASGMLQTTHKVPGEFHFDRIGNRRLAVRTAAWVESAFCGEPAR